MKRTNLVLDERLLQDAVVAFGAKTYSEAVNHALAEVARIRQLQQLAMRFGTGAWEGNLAEMREDSAGGPRREAKTKRGKK